VSNKTFLSPYILITERDYFGETLKIVVEKGDKKKEINNVPKRHLCEVSQFFAKASSDQWKSGVESVIELEHVDPKIFGIFLAWAFDRSIENSEDYIIVKDKDDVESWEYLSENRHFQLVDCYILGQKLLAYDFKNAIMDLSLKSYQFHSKKFHCIPGTSWEEICKDYRNTPKGSPLRRSLLDTVLATAELGFYDGDLLDENYQPSEAYEEYLIDLFNRARDQVPEYSRKFKTPWARESCHYHEHPGEPSS
jgi:hypothetical protein